MGESAQLALQSLKSARVDAVQRFAKRVKLAGQQQTKSSETIRLSIIRLSNIRLSSIRLPALDQWRRPVPETGVAG